MPASFRTATFNVRRFAYGKEKVDVVEAALDRLLPLRPLSLLALNEVDTSLRPSALSRLSEALGLPNTAFFGHVRGTYGNALLSAEPFIDREDVHLDGGTVVKHQGKEHRIVRGLLVAGTTIGGVPVRVGVTHLDHMDESQRAIQMGHVLRALDGGPAAPHQQLLLLGDMNALRVSDYTEAQWAEHVAHNAQKGWAAPRDSSADGGCLRLLLKSGWSDCVREMLATEASSRADNAAGGGGDGRARVVSWAVPPWSAHVHTADGPRYRIDYVFSRPPPPLVCARAPILACVAARVENATDDGARSSDHAPVAVDFVVR